MLFRHLLETLVKADVRFVVIGSKLAVLPNATHVTLMEKANAIIPMVNDFLDAKSQKP